MRRSRSWNYILIEIEPATRYTLRRKGQSWKQEFSTVSAAYFYARGQAGDGDGQMLVVDREGNECTLYLF